jgi:hypothetical protein
VALKEDEMLWYLTLDMDGVPASEREDAKAEVLDYIKEAMLADFGSGVSPVTGRAFRKLSPGYAEEKAKISGSVIPNMELHGNLLSALEAQSERGNTISVGWTDPEEAAKAHGHTTGADGRLPVRKLLPAPGETMSRSIMQGIESILDRYRGES